MEVTNTLDDIEQFIKSLPWKFEEPLMKAFEFILFCAFQLQNEPEGFRSWGANFSGHQFVTVLKLLKADTTKWRTKLRDNLVAIFRLPADWLPKWPLEQPKP